jgi:hypothetical protein
MRTKNLTPFAFGSKVTSRELLQIKMTSSSMAALGMVLTAAMCLGCITTVDYMTTGGKVLRKGDLEYYSEVLDSKVALDAIRESAAHDLQCPTESVAPQYVSREQYVADGCGLRATYKAVLGVDSGRYVVRHVLVGRFPLAVPGSPGRVPAPGPGP